VENKKVTVTMAQPGQAQNQTIIPDEAYLSLQQDLLQAFYRSQCPSAQTLSDFYMEILPFETRHSVQVHLQICPHCTFEMEDLAQFLA
jgi:hypothetical protein